MPNPTSADLLGVLSALRERVLGISESVLATADGLLVVADAVTVHPESVAALAAAALGLGHRLADHTGAGALRDVVTHCSAGQITVIAVGDRALLAVLGDEGLDTAALRRETPLVVDRLHQLLAADAAR